MKTSENTDAQIEIGDKCQLSQLTPGTELKIVDPPENKPHLHRRFYLGKKPGQVFYMEFDMQIRQWTYGVFQWCLSRDTIVQVLRLPN